MGNVAYQLREKQEQAQQRINRSSTVIVEKGRITKGEVVLLTVLAIVFFLASIFVISNYATIQSLNRDVHVLQAEVENRVRINEDLQLQVTELSDPDRIMTIAKEKLGLSLDEKNVKVITE
ncbi:cell division protein FtsL [Pueribacillus sp. YX66]|uniref:cell division protein FtsL n=1 Tax=Pueribacillus sp. YX66 TaxID=3229242 RepID=UPI00358D1B35